MNERLASHSLTAFSANVSKTGWRSNVERPITLSSSLVAACCSRASASSRASRAIFVSLLKVVTRRLRAGFDAVPRFALIFCCAFAGLLLLARSPLTRPYLGGTPVSPRRQQVVWRDTQSSTRLAPLG